jgi:hypothetical protein
LLAEDAVAEEMKFDDDSNDWDSSDIKKWLNEDFYSAAFSDAEREAILTSTYSYGGENEDFDKEAASKVFLLSTDEANDSRFFADKTDRAMVEYWWLRSPGDYYVIAAGVCSGGGVLENGYSVDYWRAVRPALKINLASSIFTSSSSNYEILYPVTVKMRDAYGQPIYGAAVTADSPKQKYFTGKDGTVLMKLGAGKQKIRGLAADREAREITLDVRPGGRGIVVDMPAAPASAISFPILTGTVSDDAGDLSRGVWTEVHRWITFGEHDGEPIIWRILEAGEADDGLPIAFLLAEDAVAGMPYDDFSDDWNSDSSNDWNSSDIKRWLNEDFYHGAFGEQERDAIVNRTYSYGGDYEDSDRAAASKVYLLSAEEVIDERFFANDADRMIGADWWLRSPGLGDVFTARVSSGGEVYVGGSYINREYAVRPALRINLASSVFTFSIFKSSFSKYEILHPVTVYARDAESKRPIRGAAVAADSPKQKYHTGDDGTVEMKLRAERQTIRLSAIGRGVYEVTLDVKPGGGRIEVDM